METNASILTHEPGSTSTGTGHPHVAIVRRHVPERLWCNFEATGHAIDLTVFETAPESAEVHAPNSDAAFRLVRKPAESVAAIHALLDHYNPDVVLCFGWGDLCSLASLSWARKNGRRTIVSSDSNATDFKRSWPKEFVKAQILTAFDLAWAASGQSANYLENLGFPADRILTGALDTVDLEHFERGALVARGQSAQLRQDKGLPEAFFLCVARLSPEKNFERLLQAYARYHHSESASCWDLVIVGDGALRTQLETQTVDLEIAPYVHFRGAADYDELPSYYGLASAFVLASLKDTWAVVVNEAAAAHLPLLVSTKAGSCEELVQDGKNGFSFDPYDIDGLADHMAKLSSGAYELAVMGSLSREIVQGHGPQAYGEALSAQAKRALTLKPQRLRPLARLACKAQMAMLA